jgi:hypothetical protein
MTTHTQALSYGQCEGRYAEDARVPELLHGESGKTMTQ